jgi:hypothetical protein
VAQQISLRKKTVADDGERVYKQLLGIVDKQKRQIEALQQ